MALRPGLAAGLPLSCYSNHGFCFGPCQIPVPIKWQMVRICDSSGGRLHISGQAWLIDVAQKVGYTDFAARLGPQDRRGGLVLFTAIPARNHSDLRLVANAGTPY
jgi:hypothetical protein